MLMNRIFFWFFLVVVIPLITLIGVYNFTIGHYGMFSVNVLTFMVSIYNVYNAHRNIKNLKAIGTSVLADQINRTINGGK